jgi:Fe-S-cluster containining protein
MVELRNIKEWCGVRHIEFRDFLDITVEGLCTYLGQMRECTIYPVRPFLCRILGVSLALPCPMHGWVCKHRGVLNVPQSDALYEAVYLHGKEKARTEKHRRIVLETLKRVAPELLQQ